MKIILRKDHELLGNAGELLDVKDGYARNYLIPHGIATAASPSNIKAYEETRRQQSRKIEKEKEDARKVAAQLEGTEVRVQVKAGEEDKVFGSVTSQMIYDALVEKGFNTIDKKKIVLKESIKTLGEHSVNVRLYSEVSANLKVVVEKEGTEHAQPEMHSEAPAEENAAENTAEETAQQEAPADTNS
jgi:large subunit ribosomal protein L9